MSRTEQQDGQTLVVFAVVAAFVLVGIVALVGDTQVLYVNYNRADGAALLAAQAGASAIDESAIYQNVIRVNPDSARARCQSAAQQVPNIVDVRCLIDGNNVTATIEQRVDMPVPPFSAQTVRATRTARPAFGGRSGGF